MTWVRANLEIGRKSGQQDSVAGAGEMGGTMASVKRRQGRDAEWGIPLTGGSGVCSLGARGPYTAEALRDPQGHSDLGPAPSGSGSC